MQKAFITTVHSVMSDQSLLDRLATKSNRLTRSAMLNIVPVACQEISTIGKILPELQGKITGNFFWYWRAVTSISQVSNLKRSRDFDILILSFKTVDCKSKEIAFQAWNFVFRFPFVVYWTLRLEFVKAANCRTSTTPLRTPLNVLWAEFCVTRKRKWSPLILLVQQILLKTVLFLV